MAYEKNTWASGDVVTSAKLNNIENGIASGGVLQVNITENDQVYSTDKTWQEMKDATFVIGRSAYTLGATENVDLFLLMHLDFEEGEGYLAVFIDKNKEPWGFWAENATDCPSFDAS